MFFFGVPSLLQDARHLPLRERGEIHERACGRSLPAEVCKALPIVGAARGLGRSVWYSQISSQFDGYPQIGMSSDQLSRKSVNFDQIVTNKSMIFTQGIAA